MRSIITLIAISLLPLFAQEDFLKGVRAQSLRLARITNPAVEDTIGISDWSAYFYGTQNRVVNPNGQLLAEVRDKGIWVVNLTEGEETKIDDRGVMPKWSPNGRLIAFLKQKERVGKFWRGHQLYDGEELWIYDLNSGDKRKFTSNLSVNEFMWTPDGEKIVLNYDSMSTKRESPNLLGVMDIQTKRIIIIDAGPSNSEITFSLSPDGRMIAYCKPLKEELMADWYVTDAEIFIANIDGTDKTQITDTEIVETMVKWLPDGKSLIVEQQGLTPDDFSFPRYVKIVLEKE